MLDRSKCGRRYDAQFRKDAVALVGSGRPYTKVAAELGISTSALKRWLEEAAARQAPAATPPATTLSAEQHELRRLRRELEEVCLQRDILKKALAICSTTTPTTPSR